jgi:LysM repeat protein
MIAQVANGFGQLITVAEILEANPGLDDTKLKVGQRILIPGGNANGSPAPEREESTPVPGE